MTFLLVAGCALHRPPPPWQSTTQLPLVPAYCKMLPSWQHYLAMRDKRMPCWKWKDRHDVCEPAMRGYRNALKWTSGPVSWMVRAVEQSRPA